MRLYIGINDPTGRDTRVEGKVGGFRGWTGLKDVDVDVDLGEGRRLKFVVLPLNALILKVNFAEGDSDAKAWSERVEGFKDIL